MSKKISTAIKGALLLFGIGGIIGGLFSEGLSLGNRVFYICIGISACLVALVSGVRWIVLTLLFGGLSFVSTDLIIDDSGHFNAAGLLEFILFLGATVYFGHKVYNRFRNQQRYRFFNNSVTMAKIDRMTGLEFEHYTAKLLGRLGYTNVAVTKASGDQGIDVLAQKSGVKYAIQCKNYQNKLDNTPVQEAYAGKDFYNCDVGVVITNSTFTEGAYDLAGKIGVLLWDRQVLKEMISKARKKSPSIFASTAPFDTGSNASASSTDAHNQPTLQPVASTDDTEIIAPETTINTDAFLEGDSEFFCAAVDIIMTNQIATVSIIQRKLKLGYAQAARIMDIMEANGIVGPFQGSTPREILITPAQWELIRSKIPFNISQESADCIDKNKPRKQESVDEQFVAEAQWYAASDR